MAQQKREDAEKNPVQKFFSEISAVGFRYIVDSKNKFVKLFWIVSLILSFVFVLLHWHSLISSYLKYPVVEVVEFRETNPPLPAVTFCSNDPISQVNIQRYLNNSELYLDRLEYQMRIGHNVGLFSSLTRQISTNIGHRISDMVLNCDKCENGKSFWKLYQVAKTFNCYTFIPVEKSYTSLDSNINALNFVLYKERTHRFRNPFARNTDLSADMSFIIHQEGEMPDVSHAISVPMGVKMSVILRGKYTVRYYPNILFQLCKMLRIVSQ